MLQPAAVTVDQKHKVPEFKRAFLTLREQAGSKCPRNDITCPCPGSAPFALSIKRNWRLKMCSYYPLHRDLFSCRLLQQFYGSFFSGKTQSVGEVRS